MLYLKYLNIPVIAPNVEKFKHLFSKTGARLLLKNNKLAIPPGMYLLKL